MPDLLNNIYEKYKKWVVAFQVGGKKYYTISGLDLSEKQNPQDKFLCNSSDKIVIFKNKKDIVENLKCYESVFFDKSNFRKFAKEISKLKPAKIKSVVIDCDFILSEIYKMKFTENFLKNYAFFSSFVNLINIIDDYAQQFNDGLLLIQLEDEDIRNLWEHFYDLFIWRGTPYDYKNSAIKKTTSSKDKVVLKFELLLLNFSSKLASFN